MGVWTGKLLFTSPWRSFFAGGGWDDESEDGYFWTENKQYLLLFVTPRKREAASPDGKLHWLNSERLFPR